MSSLIRFAAQRHVTLWSGPMSRPSIGDTPMTDAERQARYRAARADGAPGRPLSGRPAQPNPALE